MTYEFKERPIYDDLPGVLHFEGDLVTLDTADYNIFEIREGDVLMVRHSNEYTRKTLRDVQGRAKFYGGKFCRLLPGPSRKFITLKNDIPSLFDYEIGEIVTLYKDKYYDPIDGNEGTSGEVISVDSKLDHFTFKENDKTEETKIQFRNVYDIRAFNVE